MRPVMTVSHVRTYVIHWVAFSAADLPGRTESPVKDVRAFSLDLIICFRRLAPLLRLG